MEATLQSVQHTELRHRTQYFGRISIDTQRYRWVFIGFIFTTSIRQSDDEWELTKWIMFKDKPFNFAPWSIAVKWIRVQNVISSLFFFILRQYFGSKRIYFFQSFFFVFILVVSTFFLSKSLSDDVHYMSRASKQAK